MRLITVLICLLHGFIGLLAFAKENNSNIIVKGQQNKSCPHLFEFSFTQNWRHNSINLYADCKSLDWQVCDQRHGIWEATCVTQNDTTCDFENYNPGVYENCPSCSWELDGIHHNDVKGCVPYIIDKDCPASLDFFKYSELEWLACHNGSALGVFTSLRRHFTCQVVLQYNESKLSKIGNIECPSCDDSNDIGWSLKDEEYFDDDFYAPGFLVVETDSSCVEAANDGSCTVPHFKHDDLHWYWCAKGHGHGVFSINLNDKLLQCGVKVATEAPFPCAESGKSCGIIHCDGCDGSWNMPDTSEFYYEQPRGCISNSNDNSLILPLSIVGSVVFAGIVSATTIIVACVCYRHYKRQEYQPLN